MKIGYLINQYPSISHSFIRREIEALERRGVEVARYSIRSSQNGAIAAEDRREAGLTRRIVGAPPTALVAAMTASVLARPLGSFRALLAALRLGVRSESGLLRHVFYAAEALVVASWMRAAKLDHLHAHFGTNSATVAMLAADINGATFSMTVHGPEEFDKPDLIALPEKIRRAALTIGVSSFGVAQLRRLVAQERWDRIRVAHCGVEQSFHEGDIAPPDGETFVCVGRLCEQKGQLTLIEAAAEARRRGGRFRLALIGDGELRAEIEAAISRRGLGACVELAGWKSPQEVRAAIESARAFILPSYAEGLPVSIMEAMALGRPVISTFVAGIPELVLPGENGWLVPAGDAMALAGAMLSALSASPERIAEMGAAARERALERHDIDRIAAQLESLFADAARTGGA